MGKKIDTNYDNIVRFDWAMKRLLRDKANFAVLEGFLSSLLESEIKIDNILESESNKEDAENKMNRVDILAENSKKEKILIEVQNQPEDCYFHRMLFGTSKLINDFLKSGQGYGDIVKVYSINIVYFNLGEGDDDVYIGRTEFRGMRTGTKLMLPERWRKKYDVDDISDLYPESFILRVNNFDRWSKTPLDQWMYFLSSGFVPDEADAPGLVEARERLKVASLSPEEKRAYYHHLDDMLGWEGVARTAHEEGEWEGLQRGLEQGRAEGFELGIEQGMERARAEAREDKLAAARVLLASGVDINVICKATGLGKDAVDALLKP